MMNTSKAFWESPVFAGDEDRTLAARTLNHLIWVILSILGIAFILTPFIFIRITMSLFIILALSAILLISRTLMRRGRVQPAGAIVLSGIWLAFTGIIVFGGGLANINVVFFIFLTVLAGLLMGRRAAIFFSILSIAVGLSLALIENLNGLPPRYFASTPLGNWAELSFAIILTTTVMHLALRNREDALRDARRQFAERFLVEQALEKNEAFLRLITENIADAIRVIDLKTMRYTYANAAAIKMFSIPECDYVGMTIGRTLDDSSRKHMLELIRDELEHDAERDHQRSWIYEMREMSHTNGSYYWTEVNATFMRDADGKPSAILSITRNITGRKATEQALRESEEKYRTLSNNIPDVIYSLDSMGNVLAVNEHAVSRYGYDAQMIIGKPFLDIIHPDDRERVVHSFLKAMEDHREYTRGLQFRILAKDESVRWVELNSHMRFDEKGIYLQEEGVLRDITERKAVEQALQESETLFRGTFEQAAVGIANVSLAGRFIRVNQRFCDIVGYGKEEMLTMTFQDITWPDDLETDLNNVRQVLDGLINAYSMEKRYIRKDGLLVWANLTVALLREATGEPMHFVSVVEDITDRKRAEKALKESESKYRLLANNVNDVIFVLDMNLNYTYVSPSVKILRGYEPEEVLKQPPLKTLTPSSWDLATKTLSEAIELEKSGHREISESRTLQLEMNRKDGTTVWTEVKFSFIRDENQRPVGILGVTRDITERKRVGDALRQSEEQLRLVTDNMVDLVLQTDTQAVFQYFTPSITRLLGYRIEDVMGGYAFDFVHPNDRDNAMNAFQQAIKTGRGMIEARLRHNEGHYIWMELVGNVFYTEKGDAKGIIMGGRDITGRKRMQEALISASRRLNDIIDFLPDATLVIDEEGRVITWNRAIESMTGVKAGEMLGRGNYEYALPFYGERKPILIDLALHPDPEKEKTYTSIQRTGDIIIGEAYTPALPSGDVHMSAVASVLRDSKGEIIGAIECIRNNTDRKKMEERLQRAEKMESLGVLAGGVAHDLNNVLGVLVGYSELLLREVPEGGRAGKYATSILHGGERAAAIIQDLLTMARRGVSVSETVNLNKIVTDFLKTPEFEIIKFKHSDILFRSQLERDLFNIKGSPVHLFKTIMNLLSNAAESICGAGEVTIMTENRYVDVPIPGYENTQEGEYVVLMVSDTGSGISPADLGRIFEPFYTKKVMGRSGTGLGLAVVWGTVKDHGGYIDVRSEQNKGSAFTLYFPASRETLSKGDQDLPPDSYPGRGESILIVDDVEAQRLLAATILEDLNYRVATAASGEDAVEYLRANRADLVVLDMIMDPGIDGLETYRRILEIRPQQKAIIVSGFAKTGRVKTAQELGAGEYVKKPYVIDKLGMAVRRELDKK